MPICTPGASRHRFEAVGVPPRSQRCALALQRIVLRTERGWLRPVWRVAYEALLRGCARGLTAGEDGATVYACSSIGQGRPVYGLADIDLAIVVPDDPRGPQLARRRVVARHERLCRAMPWLCDTILDRPLVFEPADLAEAASEPVLTYGLEPAPGRPATARAVYFGERAHADRIRLHERPCLYGPRSEWRLVSGPDRLPSRGGRDRQRVRMAAWHELQAWWRIVMHAWRWPPGPRLADVCVKAVAEPVRIWLWLCRGERVRSRREALERALRVLPDQERELRRALALERDLAREPAPSLAEFLRCFVALSARLARALEGELAEAGAVDVALVWGGPDELALPPNHAFRLASIAPQPPWLLPLADWRALARTSLRLDADDAPALADETLAPLPLDPAELADLAAAVDAGDDGPYPALRRDGLLVLASARWPRTQLRAVQCRPTDPVSFALLDGDESASCPQVPGWSAHDCASRAVAEHAAWLSRPGELAQGGAALGMLITATRAALFLESIARGAPELTLTAAATLRALRGESRELNVIDDAQDGYRRFRLDATAPAPATVTALRELVEALPAYRVRD